MKPTIKNIREIVNLSSIQYYNDKRSNFNRIKLNERLSYEEMALLDRKLSEKFPNYSFAIGNIATKTDYRPPTLSEKKLVGPSDNRIVTAIKFW